MTKVAQYSFSDPAGSDTANAEYRWDARHVLASIVEASVDAIVYLDPDLIIRTWNRGAENTYGYSVAEAIGRSFEILIPANKLEEWRRLCDRPDLKVCVQGLETVRIRQDGYRLRVSETFSPVRGADGNFAGFSSISRDISARKIAEENLQKSEARYRLLANAMPQIVFTANEFGDNQFVNERWSVYSGHPAEHALGSAWLSIIHPEDQKHSISGWLKATGTGGTFESEHRLLRADGEYRWHLTRAVPVRAADGLVTGWIGTSTDIHDRKVAEANLALSEERVRLAQSAAGLVIWDLDLRLDRYAETADFFQQFEFEPGTPVGFADWILRIHPGDRDRIRAITSDPAMHASGFEIRFRVLRSDGTLRNLVGKGSTILDSQGRPARVIGVNVEDFTR
jgi:PAS domain S-box-containing protein